MMLAPEKGANTDDPTGRDCCGRQDRPVGHLVGRGEVRVSSSNADVNQLCCPTPVATGLLSVEGVVM
jgi:hypothetical protein